MGKTSTNILSGNENLQIGLISSKNTAQQIGYINKLQTDL